MIGTWHAMVLDCADPGALASFYQELLGVIRVQEDEDGSWVGIGDAPDRPALAFQCVDDDVSPALSSVSAAVRQRDSTHGDHVPLAADGLRQWAHA